jgi:hypothetical protein
LWFDEAFPVAAAHARRRSPYPCVSRVAPLCGSLRAEAQPYGKRLRLTDPFLTACAADPALVDGAALGLVPATHIGFGIK